MNTSDAASAFEPWLERWRLTPDGEPLTTRLGSQLLPVCADGVRAMLKVSPHLEEQRGGQLMEWYAGAGAAQVLAREGEALLLERLEGVRSLSAMARSGDDAEATRILCRTALALHAPKEHPPPDSLVPLDVWFDALREAQARHGSTFAPAAAAARDLLAEPRDIVVLHGDFHHDNVLDGGDRGWLVIDPKGLIGERGFEYANLFRNPDLATALAPGQIERRAEIVAAEAGLDIRRLLQWTLAYAGLGAAWSLEDGDDPRPGLEIAQAVAALLQSA